jgi:hypothetical protein
VEINILFDGKDDSSPGIRCSGVVVDCEKEEDGSGYLVGLYFMDMNSEDRRAISRYLEG